ncbi:ion transporter [Rhodobacteraceae bacterium nBUS_24]|jgi:voltage-gated potassium channel|nr:ion transporter [Marinovum sp.]MBT6507164.1 ion transporter [Marinovum sp.]MBT6533814.1 ion transporter [Marinovum sp.]
MGYAQFQNRVLEILEPGRSGDWASKVCDYFIAALVILNILAVTLESVSDFSVNYARQFYFVESFSVVIFSVEYLMRVWASAAKHDAGGRILGSVRLGYIFSFSGLIDLVSILPFYLQALFPGLDLRVLRTLRLLRIFKLSNYNTAIEDLFSAIYEERKSFFAAFYLLVIAFVLTSSLIYFAEHRAQPDKFSSIPDAMYWSLITLTTVGYGDVSPVTWIGKVISVITALMGVSVVALITGIIANAFSNQIARRKLIFEDQIREAMEDGVVDAIETRSLEELRKEFGLSKQQADALMRHVQREKKDREA